MTKKIESGLPRLNVQQLQAIAKRNGVTAISKLNRNDLVAKMEKEIPATQFATPYRGEY